MQSSMPKSIAEKKRIFYEDSSSILLSQRKDEKNDTDSVVKQVEEIIGSEASQKMNFGLSLNEETDKSRLRRVLIADDCPFNIVALQSLLQQFSLDCDYSTNGLDAFKAVKQRIDHGLPIYELILLDYSMPVCDGPSGCTLIRELFEQENIA